jgi:hypothetical protein
LLNQERNDAKSWLFIQRISCLAARKVRGKANKKLRRAQSAWRNFLFK